MSIESLVPLAALLVGWFLKGAESYVGGVRAERRAVGLAIADLLELRHSVYVYRLTLNELKKRFPIAAADEIQLRQLFLALVMPSSNLHERYDQAVTIIAERDPLLAFRLRSQNAVEKFVHMVLQPGDDSQAQALSLATEGRLTELALENLEAAILVLSKKRSFVLWLRVRRRLAQSAASIELPEAVERILGELQASIQCASEAGGPAPTALHPG